MTITDVTTQDTWQAWRAERATELSIPFGWLSLNGLVWLSDEPAEYPGLPGKWWGAQERISVQLDEADSVAVGDSATTGAVPSVLGFAGTHQISAPEGSSTIGAVLADGTRVEFLTRTGKQVLRLRSTEIQALADGGLVPAFEYNPVWLKTATITWSAKQQSEIVAAAQPGLSHNVKVPGTLSFEHEGQTHVLRLTGERGGAISVLFSDTSQGVAPWRILTLKARGLGEVEDIEVDFNYTQNLPFAFSDFGTCPAPLAGNHLTVPVEAGERSPR